MTALTLRSSALAASGLDYFLIDGSGSMQSKWWETIAAVEEYTSLLKRAHANSHLIVSTFSDQEPERVQRDGALADSASLLESPLTSAFGGTPLFDAINAAARNLRKLSPERATLLIVTDGQENNSRFTSLAQAKALLDWCRARGWQVIFWGCDFNNSLQAKALGANPATAIGVSSGLMKEAAAMLARKRLHYDRTGDSINFTRDEQQQFGGLLPPPSGGA
jgi:Mg-chelatase subunit ChlD